jgi:AcrR family transcriptional regulator
VSRRRTATLGPHPARSDEDYTEAIVDAAGRCFARSGVDQTRVEDIAAEVGIARPNIYRYFASKDAILHAVVLNQMAKHQAMLAERFPFEGPAADIIIGWLVGGVYDAAPEAVALTRSGSTRITARELASSPEILDFIRRHWEPLLEYAHRRGELRPGVDVEAAAKWLMFLQFSYLALPELTPRRAELESELRAFVLPGLVRS